MPYKPSSDRILFYTTGFLTIFGLVMVYSASSVMATSKYGSSSYYFLRQLGFAAVGFIILLFLMNVDYHTWMKPKVIGSILIVSAASLGLVLLLPKFNHVHRWIRLGPLSFQPSEIAKLAILVFIAAFLHAYEDEINRPIRRLLPLGLAVGLFAGLIAVEPDLGQALCICAFTAIMLYLAGLAWRYFVGTVVLALPAFYFLVYRVDYRWDRIKAFWDPSNDPLDISWQISQSLIAVGSGGFWGLGFGESWQKLLYLPEASSDFIFAVIGEELGLIGTSLLAIAFLVYFYRGLKIALRSPDRFGFFLGLGITLMVVLQGFINISMVLAMIPTKGIALPFISQGGSSLLLNLIATGILLNVSNHRSIPVETQS